MAAGEDPVSVIGRDPSSQQVPTKRSACEG